MSNQSKSPEFRYHAFISYRHADNKEQGRQWATWLHQAIETYEVPADLVGQMTERGEEIPARIYPIFRDEQELPAHSDLGQSIVKALEETRTLIVLCSPRAVASTYVADEIDYFKKLGRSGSIIAAMIDGEPNASWDEGKRKLGFSADAECFPVPLQFAYDEQGNRTEKRAEPIAADFRINNDGQPEQGWTSPEAYRQHLKTDARLNSQQIQKQLDAYQKQQHLMLMKIIAGILGLPLGELTRRDKEYQLEQARLKAKRLRQWLAAVAVLAICAIGAGVIAYFKQVEAEEQRDNALITQSNFLLDLASQENDKRNFDAALLLGLNALPGTYGGQRPHPESSTMALHRSIINNQKKVVLDGHKGPVNKAVFSPNEQYVVTISDDSTALLWSVFSGEKLRTFQHQANVTNAEFSPDGQTLITTSDDSTVLLWSVSSGEKLRTFEHQDNVISSALSPDGQTLLTACKDSTAVFWSVHSGEKLTILQHQNAVHYAAFSPDGQKVLTTSDQTATIWTVPNGEKLATFQHQFYITHAAFSPDGQNLLTASGDSTAALWSISNGKKLKTFQHQDWVEHAAFSPDGQYVVTACVDATATIWSAYSGKKFATLKHQDEVRYAIFSPDGQTVITASWDNTIAFWQPFNNSRVKTFNHSKGVNHLAISQDNHLVISSSYDNTAVIWNVSTNDNVRNLEHRGWVLHSNFSPDGSILATASRDSTAVLWDVTNGEKIITIEHQAPILKVKFSPDGRTVLTASSDRTAALWSSSNGEKLQTFRHLETVSNASFSPDGQAILTISDDSTAVLWSATNGKKITTFQHQDQVKFASFSPDGQTVLTASKDQTSVLWAINGEKIYTFNEQGAATPISIATFSPDGKIVAIGGQMVTLWSTKNGKFLHTLTHEPQNCISFSPDSHFVVTCADQSAVVWSVPSGKKSKEFEHNKWVENAVFSLDGQYLLTASYDHTAALWSLASGDKVRLIEHQEGVLHAEFSPDGQSVATVSYDGTARISPLLLNNLTDVALNSIPKNRTCLTPEERKKSFLNDLTDEQWIERGCPQFTQAARLEEK